MSNSELFTRAIKDGNTEQVRELLAAHTSLRKSLNDALRGGNFGETALIATLHLGNKDIAQLLLDNGADINQKSHWWAGGFGVLDQNGADTEWLVARGATVDAYAAARWSMIDKLRAIVEQTPDAVHTRGGDGQTPLHVAATIEIAAYLLDHGADINAIDVDHESTAAQYLVREHTDVARYLVTRGAHVDVFLAAALGDVSRAKALLDADPNCVNLTIANESFPRRNRHASMPIYFWTLGAHKTPHHVARDFNHSDVLELLMSRSSDDLKIQVACELEDEALLAQLHAAGAKLSAPMSIKLQGRLVLAAELGRTKCARLMLAEGWPVNARHGKNVSTLHFAAWHGNAELVTELLARGASTDVKESEHGATPRGWAQHGKENSWHRERGDYDAVLKLLPE